MIVVVLVSDCISDIASLLVSDCDSEFDSE